MEREGAHVSDYERKVLYAHYPIMAVDPYSLGIDLTDPEEAKVRLSYYSHQITHFAANLHRIGSIDRIVVFGDASFGPDFPSTGQLMKTHFVERDGISEDDIYLFDQEDQEQTATQVQKLAGFMKIARLKGAPVLYPMWKYHEERVGNHAKGFGVNVVTAPIEELYQDTGIGYEFQRMINKLPLDEAENMESFRRTVSRWDKRGYVSRIAKPVLGGAHMLDNTRNQDGTLSFEYKPGKKKLTEVGLK